MSDVLVVAVEEIWPPRQGGQVRVAGLVEALAEAFDVAVAVPTITDDLKRPVPAYDLQAGPPNPQLRHFLSRAPRLGQAMLGPAGSTRLAELVRTLRPRVVLFTQSYLAEVAGPVDAATMVDFQNLEGARLRSFASHGALKNRISALAEARKARSWEPRLARRVGLCTALSDADTSTLQRWGANALHVPNGVRHARETFPSPERGHILYLGSADYSPNRQAGEWLVRSVWPLARAAAADARLVLAGRRSDVVYSEFAGVAGVEIAGEVDDVVPLIENAAVVLAPATSGGGQQLKVIEALSLGRVVIATPFSARSVPAQLNGLCLVADGAEEYARALVGMVQDPTRRWAMERAASSAVNALPTWSCAAKAAVEWIGEQPC